MLATADLGAGFGFGLFGLLSIIRLRSSEIAQAEVACYFVALSLGLICGIQPDPTWLAPLLGTLLVAVMAVGDHPRLHSRQRRQLVTLDSAITDEGVLRERLARLLHADVQHVVVNERELTLVMTVVDVRYRVHADARAAVALDTRVDRKHIAPPGVVAAVTGDLAYRMAVLEMGGRRAFSYESTYFDTEDLRCFPGRRS